MSSAAFDEWEQEDDETGATSDGSVARYLDEIGRHGLLSRAEEVDLARLAAAGDEAARRRLVEANLRLVVAIARRYRGSGLELLDLIQEGNLGLMTAAARYDRRTDVSFATYAAWWIRREICRALSTKSRLVRLPYRLAESSTQVQRAERRLTQRLRRAPSVEDVAREAGVSAEVVADLRRAALAPVSLSEGSGDGEPGLAELLADDAAVDPGLMVASGEQTTQVRVALAAVGERSRRVVELRCGLDGEEARTLQQAARELGLSRERVRQLEGRGLRQLAEHPELQSLRRAA